MARQDRTKNSAFPQAPDCPITQVALYARISTLNNQDPELQLAELREYAKRRGWQITEEYTDHGVSGCKESRPALNRLMADACRRKFDAILVWKIDRFGRSLKHLVTALAELRALGVAFISLRDNLDLTTPSGRLMFQIIGAMAEFERALIQERVRSSSSFSSAWNSSGVRISGSDNREPPCRTRVMGFSRRSSHRIAHSNRICSVLRRRVQDGDTCGFIK
jgi:predicted site-specific integrase-resolvase